jgi:hypothetical protein
MTDIENQAVNDGPATAFIFHGNWQEFAKIALPNVVRRQ